MVYNGNITILQILGETIKTRNIFVLPDKLTRLLVTEVGACIPDSNCK